ncbi:LysR substrate-binding domain-containing protein [Variovorax sp. EBFNA2]|uniref:LysR substrate-binding domain-containing protein n=1 Tax=Variovorax sp. EBFNA2 TaxID=3342097 RepID=UPI0029BFE880|nr:LysR substrate-binding domain-containing protein [Variovorax boronicumulans]WPG36276.1 LysR substrate-binding domain-containing protein [Variovorax boronicumulans]
MELSVCAAPTYWREHGVPVDPSELAHHVALTSAQLNPLPKWRFGTDGQPIEVTVRGTLDATESGPLVQAALLGAGVVYLPSVILKPYVESGRLVPVFSDFVRRDMWLSAVYMQRRHSTAVHRALLDFLADRLKSAGARVRTAAQVS